MLRCALGGLVLGCSVMLAAGCGSRVEPPDEAPPDPVVVLPPEAERNEGPVPAEVKRVTLHVADMTERLGLT